MTDAPTPRTDADASVLAMKSDPVWYERVATLNAEVSRLNSKLTAAPPVAESQEVAEAVELLRECREYIDSLRHTFDYERKGSAIVAKLDALLAAREGK